MCSKQLVESKITSASLFEIKIFQFEFKKNLLSLALFTNNTVHATLSKNNKVVRHYNIYESQLIDM